MAGTYESSAKAAKTNKERHGENFYARIGAIGGAKSRGGGFTGEPERAKEMGRKGGLQPKPPWTDERRLQQSLRSREYWERKRNG